MSNVPVEKIKEEDAEKSPLIRRINDMFRAVEERAFELFHRTGGENGHSLDHWLQAEREIFSPTKAELSVRDDRVEIQVALPGFESSEIEVSATPNEIVVHASHKGEKSGQDEHVHWSEFEQKAVCRRFPLPCAIDVESARSELALGMLKLTAAKAKSEAESGSAKKVTIKAA